MVLNWFAVDLHLSRFQNPVKIGLRWVSISTAPVEIKKQARKLQATLVRNYDPPTDWLTHSQE